MGEPQKNRGPNFEISVGVAKGGGGQDFWLKSSGGGGILKETIIQTKKTL